MEILLVAFPNRIAVMKNSIYVVHRHLATMPIRLVVMRTWLAVMRIWLRGIQNQLAMSQNLLVASQTLIVVTFGRVGSTAVAVAVVPGKVGTSRIESGAVRLRRARATDAGEARHRCRRAVQTGCGKTTIPGGAPPVGSLVPPEPIPLGGRREAHRGILSHLLQQSRDLLQDLARERLVRRREGVPPRQRRRVVRVPQREACGVDSDFVRGKRGPRPSAAGDLAASATSGYLETKDDQIVTPLVYSTELACSLNLGQPTKLTIAGATGNTVMDDAHLWTVTVEAEVTKTGDLNPTTINRSMHGTCIVAGSCAHYE